MSALRSIKWPYAVIAILAVTAASFGLLRPQLTTASASAKKNPGATERIKENPPPTLFTDAAITPLGTQVTAQHKKADDLFARWKAQHGTTRDDKAFAAWAARQIPAPPSAKARTAELHQVQQLAKTRTAPGKKAATWLELYGKKDIWKLYQHDQRELIPAAQGTAEKAQLKSALKVAKTISDQLAARDKQPAPFILDPTLRPDKHIKAGAKGPYSYPPGTPPGPLPRSPCSAPSRRIAPRTTGGCRTKSSTPASTWPATYRATSSRAPCSATSSATTRSRSAGADSTCPLRGTGQAEGPRRPYSPRTHPACIAGWVTRGWWPRP